MKKLFLLLIILSSCGGPEFIQPPNTEIGWPLGIYNVTITTIEDGCNYFDDVWEDSYVVKENLGLKIIWIEGVRTTSVDGICYYGATSTNGICSLDTEIFLCLTKKDEEYKGEVEVGFDLGLCGRCKYYATLEGNKDEE